MQKVKAQKLYLNFSFYVALQITLLTLNKHVFESQIISKNLRLQKEEKVFQF